MASFNMSTSIMHKTEQMQINIMNIIIKRLHFNTIITVQPTGWPIINQHYLHANERKFKKNCRLQMLYNNIDS